MGRLISGRVTIRLAVTAERRASRSSGHSVPIPLQLAAMAIHSPLEWRFGRYLAYLSGHFPRRRGVIGIQMPVARRPAAAAERSPRRMSAEW